MNLFDFDNKFEETSVEKLNIGTDFMGDGEPLPNIPGIINNTGVIWTGGDLIAGIFTSKTNPEIILWVAVIATTPAKMIEQTIKFNHRSETEIIDHLRRIYSSNMIEIGKMSPTKRNALVKMKNALPRIEDDFTKQNPIQVKIAQEWGIGHRQGDRLDHVVRFISGYQDEDLFFIQDIIDAYVVKHSGRK
jgi:hypothetical protein